MNCNIFKRDSRTALENGVLDEAVGLSLTLAFLLGRT